MRRQKQILNNAATLCLACFENRLASVFDNATELKMFQLNDHKICPVGLLSLPSKDPKDRTSATLTCGATYLICGAICGCTRNELEHSGIHVIPWVKGTVDEVLEAYRLDQIEKLMMPGCSGRAKQKGRCRQNRAQNSFSNHKLKEKIK